MCPGGVCVPGGSRSLLKFSQPGRCWDVGRYWEAVLGVMFFGEYRQDSDDIFILE